MALWQLFDLGTPMFDQRLCQSVPVKIEEGSSSGTELKKPEIYQLLPVNEIFFRKILVFAKNQEYSTFDIKYFC